MPDAPNVVPTGAELARRHMRLGWWALLGFATAGLVLESFHGLKVRAYLDVANQTRRLMWTLAHAHGTLLAVINIVFGVSVRSMPDLLDANGRLISFTLISATVLLPAGFFLGGIGPFGSDPGLVGRIVLPIGAVLLLVALFLIARTIRSGHSESGIRSSRPRHRAQR
jgi:hypothetical protein